MSDYCLWCGGKATAWCDVVFGHERDSEGLIRLELESFGCDAPMCDQHRRHIGHIGRDTIDACPEHALSGLSFADPMPCTKESADAHRRDIYARAKRSRLKVCAP